MICIEDERSRVPLWAFSTCDCVRVLAMRWAIRWGAALCLVAPRCSIGQRFYVWDKRLIRRINEFIGNKCIYSRGFIRSYERVAMKLLFSCNEVQRKCVNFHWNK